MDNEEIQGVKFSEFPSQTPGNSDEVVGLHSGDNARFTIANIVAAVRNGLANIFVPKTDVGAAGGVASLDNTGKVPTSQLPSGTGPEPATATPLMDGTGAVGASIKYAREDHEHPADTNKQAKITANGILKGDGQGGVSAATAGTDYQAPLTAGTDYATPAQLADKADIDEIGIVINGNSSTQGADIGQYVILRNSTISYRADGLHRAAKTIPANTAIDWSYIGSVDGGGLNSINARLPKCGNVSFTVSYNGASTVQVVFDVPFPQGTNYAVSVCQSGQYAYSNLDFGSTNRTETGFDVTVSSTRSGTFTGNAFWMAIPY